jgi:hypothetical protein
MRNLAAGRGQQPLSHASPPASIGRDSDIARVTDIWVLLGAGRTGFRRDRTVLPFHEPGLERDL